MIVAMEPVTEELEQIRSRLDRLDEMLVNLIAQRAELARELGRAKRQAGMPIVDFAREAAVVRRAATHARYRGLPEEDVRDIFWDLIAVARRVQMEER
jgi:chorismate mutase